MHRQPGTAGPDSARHTEAKRVLVIEDNERDRARLVTALSAAGFEVDAAPDGPFALRWAQQTVYDALTLNVGPHDPSGLDLLGSIRTDGASRSSPVIGVTMPAGPAGTAAFPVADVLVKPLRIDEVREAMTRIPSTPGGRAVVMVIDDELAALDLMQAMLRSIDIDAVCFRDGRVALAEIATHSPDAIVLDLMMPEFDGFQVLAALQRLVPWRDVPVFIWTSRILTDEEYAALARSAQAVLTKGGGALDDMLDSIRRRGMLPAAETR